MRPCELVAMYCMVYVPTLVESIAVAVAPVRPPLLSQMSETSELAIESSTSKFLTFVVYL